MTHRSHAAFAGVVATAAADDNSAVVKAKEGDARGFEELYSTHCRRVYRICLRMTRDPSAAEDLTQDVFLQVYRKLHTFRGEASFRTWLYRVAVNEVLMKLRRDRKKIIVVSMEECMGDESELVQSEMLGGPDQMLDSSLDRVELEAAIAELPPGYRMIFILHDVEGFDHREIAEMLGCSEGNSKSQLHKARIKLRRYLVESHGRSARGAVEAACVPQ